jgi:hypothetical protein
MDYSLPSVGTIHKAFETSIRDLAESLDKRIPSVEGA